MNTTQAGLIKRKRQRGKKGVRERERQTKRLTEIREDKLLQILKKLKAGCGGPCL